MRNCPAGRAFRLVIVAVAVAVALTPVGVGVAGAAALALEPPLGGEPEERDDGLVVGVDVMLRRLRAGEEAAFWLFAVALRGILFT